MTKTQGERRKTRTRRAMRRCAFLSMESLEGFSSYDEMLIEPLRELGWRVEWVPWSREDVDWAAFEVAVIRTTWDYWDAPERFLHVLAAIAGQTRLENPIDIVRWNMDKRYLLDLESRGVPVVPTFIIGSDAPAEESLERCRATGASEIILKPVVSANAANTHRLPADTADVALPLDASEAWLLQPFLEEVVSEGEYSLFYFGGEYSHAISKHPKAGDFRVQEEHGGELRTIEPSPDLRSAADHVIASVGQNLLYARVDLVRHDNRWLLMELELIEPSLYFNMDPSSPLRFAQAFDAWIRGGWTKPR